MFVTWTNGLLRYDYDALPKGLALGTLSHLFIDISKFLIDLSSIYIVFAPSYTCIAFYWRRSSTVLVIMSICAVVDMPVSLGVPRQRQHLNLNFMALFEPSRLALHAMSARSVPLDLDLHAADDTAAGLGVRRQRYWLRLNCMALCGPLQALCML